ncbi:hypothetical protein ACOMHN_025331 [Nucella lapillus]
MLLKTHTDHLSDKTCEKKKQIYQHIRQLIQQKLQQMKNDCSQAATQNKAGVASSARKEDHEGGACQLSQATTGRGQSATGERGTARVAHLPSPLTCVTSPQPSRSVTALQGYCKNRHCQCGSLCVCVSRKKRVQQRVRLATFRFQSLLPRGYFCGFDKL